MKILTTRLLFDNMLERSRKGAVEGNRRRRDHCFVRNRRQWNIGQRHGTKRRRIVASSSAGKAFLIGEDVVAVTDDVRDERGRAESNVGHDNGCSGTDIQIANATDEVSRRNLLAFIPIRRTDLYATLKPRSKTKTKGILLNRHVFSYG
jgi:hypothetical protein